MKTESDYQWAVNPPAIELTPAFVCGGACLNGGCGSARCREKDILVYDISSGDGSAVCFIGMVKNNLMKEELL